MFSKDKQIILIDIDDTLANTRQAVFDLYVDATGDKSGNINVEDKQYVAFCPLWTDEEIEKLFYNGYVLYDRVQPMPMAQKAVTALEERGYDVRIATLHTAHGIPAKQAWVDKHFPTLSNKVIYINDTLGNKDIFKEYALIDDHYKNIKTNKSAIPILLDIYNVYRSMDRDSCIICKSWAEVMNKL